MRTLICGLVVCAAVAVGQEDERDLMFDAMQRFVVAIDSTEVARIDGLIDGLGDPDFDTREESQAALAALGIQPVPRLLARLDEASSAEEAFRIDSLLQDLVDTMELRTRTYRDGSPHTETLSFEGRKWGECTWHRNGQVEELRYYLDGVESGTWRRWWPNGQLREEYVYVGGLLQGVSRTWWDNGQLYLRCVYVDGKMHGPFQTWDKTGQTVRDGTYVEDQKHGRWQLWPGTERAAVQVWEHDRLVSEE